jgi:hypothetical protein
MCRAILCTRDGRVRMLGSAVSADKTISCVPPNRGTSSTKAADRLPDDAVAGYGYGITRILLYAGMESGGRIVAPLGGPYRDQPPPTMPFQGWWSRDAVIYPTNRPFRTRQYVVYEMANTDGIHVDPNLDADYDALTRDTHGFVVNGIPVGGNLASAAVRQVVWETQHTLHRVLPDLCGSDFPDTSAELSGGDLWRVCGPPIRRRRPAQPLNNRGYKSTRRVGSWALQQGCNTDP